VTSSDKVMTVFLFEEVTFSFILSATSFRCFITTSLTSSMFALDHSRPCCTLCATLSHRKCESVISIDTAATGIKQSTKAVDLSNELQQKSKHFGEMIENRKEIIGMIDKKTGDILANIDDVKDVV
jgi:hypothetical protein